MASDSRGWGAGTGHNMSQVALGDPCLLRHLFSRYFRFHVFFIELSVPVVKKKITHRAVILHFTMLMC
jgi:hypothetical protein